MGMARDVCGVLNFPGIRLKVWGSRYIMNAEISPWGKEIGGLLLDIA